jgi:hypothetical protein
VSKLLVRVLLDVMEEGLGARALGVVLDRACLAEADRARWLRGDEALSISERLDRLPGDGAFGRPPPV